MALPDKTLKLCNCNGTLPIDARALAAALKSATPLKIHTELCRKQVASFQGALADPELLIACTQEAPLFRELAEMADSKSELRFVNIREAAGWSSEAPAVRRLQIRGDCRVADMVENKTEATIFEYPT